MARKPNPTPNKRAKVAESATRAPEPAPSPSQQGVETPPDVQAQVWVLKEEGQSWRQIARALGMSVQTVGRILAKDPARNEALVSAKREERARLWEQVENQSLKSLTDTLRHAHAALFNKDGTLKKKLSKAEERLVDLGSRWTSSFRHVAESATRMNNLLTGGATDRVETPAAAQASEFSEDQAVTFAIEEGVVEMLPPTLRAVAYQRMQGTDAGRRTAKPQQHRPA